MSILKIFSGSRKRNQVIVTYLCDIKLQLLFKALISTGLLSLNFLNLHKAVDFKVQKLSEYRVRFGKIDILDRFSVIICDTPFGKKLLLKTIKH